MENAENQKFEFFLNNGQNVFWQTYSIDHHGILRRICENHSHLLAQGFPTYINRGPHTCLLGLKAGRMEQN